MLADHEQQTASIQCSVPLLERTNRMYVTKTPTEHEASRVGLFSESTRKLDDVVARNLPMFYRRAFRYLGNVPDAEDAVQDALVSAYKHLAQFRGKRKCRRG